MSVDPWRHNVALCHVDFNSVSFDPHAVVGLRHDIEGPLVTGQPVFLYDAEGNTCLADVLDNTGGLVYFRLLDETWRDGPGFTVENP